MIEVKGLTKRFGDRPAVLDLSFSVPRGQVLGFLGPDGAGKSTTLRILAGCLCPSTGEVTVAGLDVVGRWRDARRHIGYLAETAALFDELRVESYLDTMCRLRGMPPRPRRRRVQDALTACGLGEHRRRVIGRLPPDLRRRVGLAQAVVHEPEVLILDEPASGLDPAGKVAVRDLVAELGRERTVVVSGRTLPEVGATCDRVLVVRAGRLVADELRSDLGRRLRERRTRDVMAVVHGDAVEVERTVRGLNGVTGVRLADLGDGDHRVVVSGDRDDLLDHVARAIVERGIGLKELSWRQPATDDAFLDMTLQEAS